MVLEIRPRRCEIVERGFRGHDAKLQQAARGVVHVDEQCARRAAVLKPRMFAAIDLDELAQTRPPGPGLMRPTLPLGVGNPQPRVDHPPPVLSLLMAGEIRITKSGLVVASQLWREELQGHA